MVNAARHGLGCMGPSLVVPFTGDSDPDARLFELQRKGVVSCLRLRVCTKLPERGGGVKCLQSFEPRTDPDHSLATRRNSRGGFTSGALLADAPGLVPPKV